MRRLFGDTLFRRLFVLMWVALVGSHVLAFSVVVLLHQFVPMGDGMHATPGNHFILPTFPSLPPGPNLFGTPDAPGGPGRPGMQGRPDDPNARHGQDGPDELAFDRQPLNEGDQAQAMPMPAAPMPTGMPNWLLAIDYGIRLLVIGSAAWWGARWLSRPMHHLADASRALSASLNNNDAPPHRLNEYEGTVEVRDTARVFNDMARRLSQQFRTRGLMMAAISHDLRTPLTRIRIRMESFPDVPLAERCIGDIREMNELIDTSLEVFRDMDATEPTQATDVTALVQSLADDFIEQGQPVRFTGSPAVTQAKPSSLKRVVINLVHNAVRYGSQADVHVSQTAEHVVITIDDNGPGISPRHLEGVFEPFYRIESSRNRHTGGAGLGLYIARDLIRKQAGELTLHNRAEGGLRAEVRLPVNEVGTVVE
ncbi:MAG: ATP-binding protein [Aquabacterium sp.]